MRYIGKYESFFDVDAVVAKIARFWKDDQVDELIKAEKIEWSDNYGNLGNGEAEDHVVSVLVSWYESKYGRVEDKDSLKNAIRQHYKSLSVE